MNISGMGGTLKLAGTLVAELGKWEAEGDASGWLGKARISHVNKYYINHETGFTIALGKALRGTCVSIAVEDKTLHFHMKRGGAR